MKLRIVSIPNLIEFLKKLKVVDRSVLLELNTTKLFSKIHTADKSVMKSVSIPVDQVFEGNITTGSADRVKVGMIDITKFIDCFKNFKPSESVHIEIVHTSVDSDEVATSLKVYTDSVKISFHCADLGLLSYVDDDILGMVHDKEGASGFFRLYNSDFESIDSLCDLENNSEELLEFSLTENTVVASGHSFEYKLNISNSDIKLDNGPCTFSMYKKQLGYVDLEQTSVYIHDNRLIFSSDVKPSTIAIGLINK